MARLDWIKLQSVFRGRTVEDQMTKVELRNELITAIADQGEVAIGTFRQDHHDDFERPLVNEILGDLFIEKILAVRQIGTAGQVTFGLHSDAPPKIKELVKAISTHGAQ